MKIPVVGPAYSSRIPGWSGQELVNLFVEGGGPGAKSPAALLGTPGMTEFATLLAGGGEVRGLWAASTGDLYAVCANKLCKVTPTGVTTVLGTLETSTGPVSMGDNGVQVFLSDNPNGYVYTLASGAFSRITTATWPGAAMVDYLDGYMIGITPSSGQFWVTALYDASSIDALDFASAESNPDRLVALQVDHREVWLFGEKTVEVWYNSGDSTFPLSRVSGAFVETGCAARMSVAKADNTQFWLATNGAVVRAEGYIPRIISTRAIEAAITGYSRIDDARAFAYAMEGHTFYVLTFPSAGVTWVYDAATDMWHERASWGLGRWRANCYARLGNKHFVGDVSTGKIYRLDPEALTEAGMPIERVRVTAPVGDEDKRLIHSRFTLDVETGVTDGAQIMLSWSDDGGRTWSNEQTASLGALGEYRARAEWRRLGQSRSRMYKIRCTDPVRLAILGAYGDISKGAA